MSETGLQNDITESGSASIGGQVNRGADTRSWPKRRRDGVLAPFTVAWRYRGLILATLRRDLADRFSGTVFGWAWAVAGPLITLAIYTVTFTKAVRLPVASAQGGALQYALSTFAGLIVFSLCAELFYRAPLLLHENSSYIKTSIFPSETLAWTAVLRSLTYAGISVAVLLVFSLAINNTLPLTVLLLPLLVLPLIPLLLGLVWCLSALGAFTRDIAYLMVTIVPLLMFATPVFYRLSDVSAAVRELEYLNPIGSAIEMARNLLIDGVLPSLPLYLVFVAFALLVCRGGYAVFERYKGILVDVI
jgi:homopolymeric O-antigen transport system permease protein